MSGSEVLMSDPIAKIQTIFHPTDENGEKFVLEERQDVTELIDQNKRLYNSIDERARYKGTFNRVASIPLNVMLDCYRKGMFRSNKLSKEDKAFLNDPDNRFFRTRPGRV